MFKAVRMQVVRAKGTNPSIVSSGNNISTNHKMNILITSPKSPNVIILKGRVMIFKIGFTRKLIAPRIKLDNKKISKGPSNLTPGTYLLANHRPSAAIEKWRISFFTASQLVYKRYQIFSQKST